MRKKTVLSLSINPGDDDRLKKIALELGLLWGEEPSISGLLRAIAEGEVICLKKDEWQSRQQVASRLIEISQSIQEEVKELLK